MDREELDRGAARTAAELRVQLAQMTMASQMLERNAWDERGRGYLAALNQSICRMLRIVGRLELCERLSGEGGALEPAPVDLAELTTELGRRMEGLLDRAGVKLAVWCPDRLPAWADKELVEQLLLELVANGAEAVKQAAVKQVTVSLERDRDMAVFTVEDNGPGVPPQRAAELFSGGDRAKPDWRRSGNGVAIARRIAQLHGGALVADCAPDRGLRVSASIALNTGRGEDLGSPALRIDGGGFDSALVGLSHLLPAGAFLPEDYE